MSMAICLGARPVSERKPLFGVEMLQRKLVSVDRIPGYHRRLTLYTEKDSKFLAVTRSNSGKSCVLVGDLLLTRV